MNRFPGPCTIPLAVALSTICVFSSVALLGQDRRIAPLGEGSRRVALVVGNAAYINIKPLANSANDARDMAAALRDTGFTTVIEREDASRETLEAAVDEFIRALKPGDIAMFYYSGHGMQINGENYLAAVDLNVLNEVQARTRSLKASEVLEEMETSGAALNIVVLDACRDNPFGATRSIGGQGLAPMNAGKGTLIAYATAPGHTADDNRRARNGLYTSFLLQALREPGLSLEQVFKRAGGMVQQASGGRQIPWISSSVNGEFYFQAGSAPATSVSVLTPPRQPDLDAWEATRDSDNPEVLQAFLSEFPQSQYAAVARAKLVALKHREESIPAAATPVYISNSNSGAVSTANRFNVDVSVLGPDGNYLQAIPREAFRVLQNGVPQQIQSFSAAGAVSVALMIDFSMANNSLNQTRDAATKFLSNLLQEDDVAIIAYDIKPTILTDFTKDRAKTQEALSRLQGRKWIDVDLFDAVSDIADRMKGVSARKAIVLFSTGGNTSTKLDLGQATARLLEFGVPIYSILLPSSQANQSASEALRQFSSTTGGMPFSPKSYDEMQSVFQLITNAVRNHYTLTCSTLTPLTNRSSPTIEVQLVEQKR